jgi:cell wall-associated NlpC family hydrolase
MKRLVAGLLGLGVTLSGLGVVAPPVSASPTHLASPINSVGLGAATVSVAVATVWHRPSSPRVVDAPALARPVRIRAWLAAMTTSQRRALSGRADTQVVLGEAVTVVALSGSWARVVVPDQPTPLDPRGYPGWIPKRQLVSGVASAPVVTVVKATTWVLRSTGVQFLELSIGSRLVRIGSTAKQWHVRLPDGRSGYVSRSSAVTHPLAATERSMLASGHRFLGLAYLWAGTSGFGFDCSGFVELLYRVHGITIPRDADAQARAGIAVRRADLRPGDLVFFANSGGVHHVGMYVGNGMMIHAPHTGAHVEVTSISAGTFGTEYAGARRFLP